MSETKGNKGTLKQIAVKGVDDVEVIARDILLDNDRIQSNELKSEDSWVEQLTEEFYGEPTQYVELNGDLYQVTTTEYDYESRCDLDRVSPTEFTFDMVYYNGGTGLDEMLQEGFDNLSKRELKNV